MQQNAELIKRFDARTLSIRTSLVNLQLTKW